MQGGQLIRLFLYMIAQTAMQAFSQVTLKLALQRLHNYVWTWNCFSHQILLNAWMWVAVVMIIAANLFWFYILKYFPFSYAYPLTALGFVFGMLLSMFFLHETVIWSQWAGVALIMSGCFFLLR